MSVAAPAWLTGPAIVGGILAQVPVRRRRHRRPLPLLLALLGSTAALGLLGWVTRRAAVAAAARAEAREMGRAALAAAGTGTGATIDVAEATGATPSGIQVVSGTQGGSGSAGADAEGDTGAADDRDAEERVRSRVDDVVVRRAEAGIGDPSHA